MKYTYIYYIYIHIYILVAQWLFNQDDLFINKRGCLEVDKHPVLVSVGAFRGPKCLVDITGWFTCPQKSQTIHQTKLSSHGKIHPKRLAKSKSPAPRFCCTAAIATSCMLLKPEGTDSKIRPFSRTFFKTLSLRGYGSQLGTLKLDGYSKWPKLAAHPETIVSPFSFRPPCVDILIHRSVKVLQPKTRLQFPLCIVDQKTVGLTQPLYGSFRESHQGESRRRSWNCWSRDTVMLTGLFASPWKQNEMNFKSYSCGESSENLEFEAGRLVQLGFFARFHQGQRCLFSNCDLGPKSFSQILHGHSKSKPVKSLFPWRHGLPSKKKVVFPVGVFP